MADHVHRRFSGYNITAPGANAGIIDSVDSAGIVPKYHRSVARVTVALTVSSVLNVTATDGTDEHKWGLNASTPLNAADLYTFVFPWMSNADGTDMTYDFEVETDGVVEVLIVDEVPGGVI